MKLLDTIEAFGNWCAEFCYTVAHFPILGWCLAAMCLFIYMAWVLIVLVVSLVQCVYDLIVR